MLKYFLMLRIVSFLPSATEMVCALGLSDELVGVTHECDYPSEVVGKTKIISSILPLEQMTEGEIDKAVAERLRNGQSLYAVDENLLQSLQPDIIITQDLCQVCAPSGNELSQALKVLSKQPAILWMTPQSIGGIEANIRDLGAVTGRAQQAEQLIAAGQKRLTDISTRAQSVGYRPRVFCMEWLDPVYCGGHWVPEMVRIAGGVDALGREGGDSVRVAWDDVGKLDPEVLVVMPCGFHLEKVVQESGKLSEYPGWQQLSAVRNNRVFAVDANAYFARPGPRIIEGTELLAHLIHPSQFAWNGPASAYRRLEPNAG
jgi:iron complex transport system substrate-binding protein